MIREFPRTNLAKSSPCPSYSTSQTVDRPDRDSVVFSQKGWALWRRGIEMVLLAVILVTHY